MRWPRPDVLSRFGGYKPPVEPVNINTLRSGFVQAIGVTNLPEPTLASNNPAVGAFVETAPIYAGWDQHSEYVTTDTATAAIGTFAIGESPIGYIRAYHGTLTFSAGGFGGIGEFQIGIDAIGVGGDYPVLTETPWPSVAQLIVLSDASTVAGYSGVVVEVNWALYPFALPREGEA